MTGWTRKELAEIDCEFLQNSSDLGAPLTIIRTHQATGETSPLIDRAWAAAFLPRSIKRAQ